MCQSAEALKWAIVKEVEQTSDAPYLVTLTLQNCLANKEDYERLLEFMRKSVLLPILALARKKKQQGILKLRGIIRLKQPIIHLATLKMGLMQVRAEHLFTRIFISLFLAKKRLIG